MKKSLYLVFASIISLSFSQISHAQDLKSPGGDLLGVMHSSESEELPPSTQTAPEISVKYGEQPSSAVINSAKGETKLALQMIAIRNGLDRQNWSDLHVSSDGQIFNVQAAVDIMSKYKGLPYVWGGRTPSAGGFDSSGIIEYTFNQLGTKLNGNAEAQYKKTVPVPAEKALPGDLVFFSTYKPTASHVGMYIGNGRFINSNVTHGLSISSVDSWSKQFKFLGYRRIVH
ncbi:C40 family peptidase [Paenibacillus sp. Y412MC10]|uniref:C40 family peptidase n=1 Tax=Geobacillus sp. (strain Y412MC10) TaxID=481743 RepID=UPI0016435912|nr:C40 family peptidase [Paenibacillus sp. Y412MC10]